MFGNTPVSAVLGAVPPGYLTDEKRTKAYLKALTSAGLAPLFIHPAGENEKRVADMRTERERAAVADENGAVPGGVMTASTDLTTLTKYMRRYFKPAGAKRQKGTPAGFADADGAVTVNLGLNLGMSNLIVVDADYPAEVDAFITWYSTTFGVAVEEVPGPTVKSPGTLNADGSRNHRDGGHWYFAVDREVVDLSTSPVSGRDVFVDPHEVEEATGRAHSGTGDGRTKFTIKTGNSYVLIPPSVRTAGPYTLNMPDPDVDPLALLVALGAELDDGVLVSTTTASSGPDYSDEIPVTDLTPHVEELQRTAADLAEQSPVPPLTPDVADRALSMFGAIGAAAEPEPEQVPTFGEQYTLDDRLAQWWSSTTWEEVLDGPDGLWTLAGTDECGCPTFTRPHAPGESVTKKSLTAHEKGCSRGRTDDRHPAAHVWSDHAPDALLAMVDRFGRTLSAFAVYTALHFAGDFADACRAVGMPSSCAQDLTELGMTEEDMQPAEATAPASRDARREGDTDYVSSDFTPPLPHLSAPGAITSAAGRDMLDEWQVRRPDGDLLPGSWSPFGTLDDFRGVEPPGWIVEDMLQLQGLLSVLGDSGSGKSAVIIDLLCTIASGAGSWFGKHCASFPVVYVAGEGFEGAVARMRSWERVNGVSVGDRLFIVPQPVPLSDSTGAWGWIAYNARAVGAGLVVVDTLARSAVGLDENSASDMGEAITVLDKVRRTTGAAVMLVHHTARGTDRARGSNSLRGAVDSELLVTPYGDADKVTTSTGDNLPPTAHPIQVSVSKQKNGRDDAVLSLALVDEVDARRIDGADAPDGIEGVVVTDRDLQPALTRQTFGHTVAATFDPIPLPEPAALVDEVVKYLEGYDNLPRSLGQIHAGVKRPPGVDVPARLWNEQVDRAVDLAVSAGSIYRKGSTFVHKSSADPDEF